MLRNDSAVARLSVLNCQIGHMKHQTGRPMEMQDFMPYGHEEEEEASLEDVAILLTGKKVA